MLDAACVQFEPDDPEYHRVSIIDKYAVLWFALHFHLTEKDDFKIQQYVYFLKLCPDIIL